MGNFNTYTTTLDGASLTITAADNVLRFSLIAVSGTTNVTGSKTFQGNASTAISFTTGQGVTIVSPSTSVPLDGLTIDATGGICDLIISTQ